MGEKKQRTKYAALYKAAVIRINFLEKEVADVRSKLDCAISDTRFWRDSFEGAYKERGAWSKFKSWLGY